MRTGAEYGMVELDAAEKQGWVAQRADLYLAHTQIVRPRRVAALRCSVAASLPAPGQVQDHGGWAATRQTS